MKSDTNAPSGGETAASLSNIYRSLMKSPAAQAAVREAQSRLETDGELSAADRELIALCVASVNACPYCSTAHERLAEAAGVAREDVAATLSGGRPSEPRARLVVDAARRILERAGGLGPADKADLAAAGLGEGALVEIIGLIGLYTTATYAANLDRTPLDPEFRKPG
ncbi:alkylhydroperoxidase [Marinicauda salina]|uniref:Alkylhydroperoxidase n=1 Tax=Marinicauda salina TaxID=2135793 RepID=A0A2U2BUS7_9PROT|nr:carboxymuconolactone decarboxylase family protein [Marinicauda salina]PWE17763.1 alkylhydroperoxidase [Marinicauda salina]